MNEDFVTYEQALQLKQLGFDWKCYTFYHWDNWCGLSHSGICENHNMFEKCISAPTLAQVMKWLDEKYGIWIQVERDSIETKLFTCEINHADEIYHKLCGIFKTPFQAIAEGVEEAINLIHQNITCKI